MTDLSPQAQAVLDAAFGRWMEIDDIDDDIPAQVTAAALRAAADQVFPLARTPWGSTLIPVLTSQESRRRLLAIATELKNHQ